MSRQRLQVEHDRGQRGQTLILVALAMVVLLLIAGLAIDVGVWYGQRRHMQNAADAGALAGAWEICHGEPSEATQAALDYAEFNDADPTLTDVSVDASTGIVVVTATTHADLYLSGLVLSDFEIPAVAAAQCAAADSGCGMWPVAFDMPTYTNTMLSGVCNGPDQWDGGEYVSDVAARPVNSGGDFHGGSQFILWADDNTEWDPAKVNKHCTFYSQPRVGPPYELADIVGGSPMDPGNRGWVALKLLSGYDIPSDMEYCKEQDTFNCGANALKCWLRYGYIGTISLNNCLASEDGGVSSALEPAATREGHAVSIILYDSLGCPTAGNPITCSGSKTYHVAGFGCVRVEHVFDNENCKTGCPNKTLDGKDSIFFVSRLGGTSAEDIEYTLDCARSSEEPYPELRPGVMGRDIYGYGCYRHGTEWKCANSEPLDTCNKIPTTGIVVTKLCACPPTDCQGTGSGADSAINAVSLIPVP